MIESIREWIRGLAVTVIFAGFIEMIVPFGAMKKYVRMAMGLLVLLTVLEPVFGIIHRPVNFEETAQKVWAAGPLDSGQILDRAAAIRQVTEARTVEVYRQKVQAYTEAAATQVDGVASARAVVTLGRPSSSGDAPPVEEVEVTVAPGAGRAANSSSDIRVDPVRIGRIGPAGGGAKVRPPAGDPGNDSPLKRQVRAAVSSFLGLAEGKITVKVFETGAGGDGR